MTRYLTRRDRDIVLIYASWMVHPTHPFDDDIPRDNRQRVADTMVEAVHDESTRTIEDAVSIILTHADATRIIDPDGYTTASRAVATLQNMFARMTPTPMTTHPFATTCIEHFEGWLP